MGKTLTVEILGNKYSLDTDRDINEAAEIANFVDRRMKEIKENNPFISPVSVAILTALNIADELYALKKRVKELEKIMS
ncbi:cell division protein ZapA [candidate division WOR-3 bacterium]|nr:cell division protein ZapA [candidate division WOR-3 bacterium]